jgi:hypothetical protein
VAVCDLIAEPAATHSLAALRGERPAGIVNPEVLEDEAVRADADR